jgi:predicted CXXCH cytochrome family protein
LSAPANIARRLAASALALALASPAGLAAQSVVASDTPSAVATATREASYTGSATCAECHEAQHDRWRGSHHDRAMQPATPATVLASFHGSISKHGVSATFSRSGEKYQVKTQGADGRMHTYDIAFTFGVAPLQQYLVAFPGGAFQALTAAWDARPKEHGGQRWFDLYPNETTPPGDILHWTGPANTWNRMCADCHSTNLRNRYIVAERRYETTWSDINVGCEACHGPGSRHVAWAKARAEGGAHSGDVGLVVNLVDRSGAAWVQSGADGIARRSRPRTSNVELETCAPCHSRREKIADPKPGETFLDAYRPALLDAGLYFADGQMQDEVYVWGSFVQSRMFRAGVSCGDCHDPHSLRLRAEGNAVCAQCHAAARFDTPAHQHHPQGSRAARCVECHMPARTYMVIDGRHDHGFSVPRPDLTAAIGTPNACGGCHGAQSPAWAAETIASWSGKTPRPHFGTAIAAGRRLAHAAGANLLRLIANEQEPAIARATALALLPAFAVDELVSAVRRTAVDRDPLVRAGAASAAAKLPAPMRPQLVRPLLDDPIRLVRLEAGRALAASRPLLDPQATEQFDRALDDIRRAQELNTDQPQAHVGSGTLYAEMGMAADAERAYKTALEVGPYFIPTYVNLADLYRAQQRDAEAEAVLRRGLARAGDDASLRHSLGLTLVRLGRGDDALAELRRAHELTADEVRYAYVYGVALNSLGHREDALRVLEETRAGHPADAEVLIALSTIHRDAGDPVKARHYAEQLVAEWPDNRAGQQLLTVLGGR